MPGAGGSWAGRCGVTSRRNSSSTPSGWRPPAVAHRSDWCITPTAAASTPASPSAAPYATPASWLRWEAAATPTTRGRRRKLHLDHQERARPPAPLHDQRPGPTRRLRLHRRLLQPTPPPLTTRPQKSNRIRDHQPDSGRRRLARRRQQKRGNLTPLQPDTTTQLTRRPTTNQPRSQRPWAGQLVSGEHLSVGNADG